MAATSRFRSTDWILIAVVLLLLAVSAGLALAETSLVRMSRTKAMALRDDGRRGAGSLLRLVQDPEGFLNPVLLLVLISQLVTATLVGILADRWFGPVGVIAATVFEVVVIFVLAEALPKNWAVQNPERSALLLAPMVSAVVRFPPIRFISRALIGLANTLLGPRGRRIGVSESELLAMADVALEEEVIEGHERELIHSIIEFGDTVVREVMVPRPDMRTLDGDQSVSEALGVAIEAGLSRLPVHAGNVDDIVGVANAKDLIRAERAGHGGEPVRDVVRPAHFVPETKRVASLMREMQDRKYHLAIVVDEYGGTAGVVTLEDLIEELVGEIVDEYDIEEPPVQPLENGDFSVSARLAVDELSELVDAHLPTGEWDTVGGLLFNELGRVPVEGESVDVDGLTLVAERVEGNRIGRIRIVPLTKVSSASPADHDTPEPRE
ncbi:MAG TPA: hemolysin family protein [Acidimicrobiales bacterium]|nr:hemolysin family protein [Acidimicrobiales bacterium]